MKFNSKTITIKVPSIENYYPALEQSRFSVTKTQRRADALQTLLVSANTLRDRYDFTTTDYDFFEERRSDIDGIIREMEYRLSTLEKDA